MPTGCTSVGVNPPSGTSTPIRLPEERWLHITEEHSEMAGYYFEVLETVEEPEAIYEGRAGECLAVREIGDAYDRGGYEVTECLLAPEWQKIYERKALEIIHRL